jgi:DNA invertase Pin-like site-specific DNA recombinase
MSGMAEAGPRARLDGYVRVSSTRGRSGPSFISPALQRERLEAWCGLYDARLQAVFEELDESGGRADRPKLMAAIERVEAGLSDGIIVARLDRFGRSLTDALGHIDRIQRAGGTFVSVQDHFDLSTDHGRLVLRMMLSFAEYERDRIRSTWDDARRNAVARGVHGGTTPPVGYRRRPDGRLQPHPRAAKVVREAFQMRAGGAALREVGALLRERRVRSGRGTTVWGPSSVQRMFANRVYLGEVRCGRHVLAGAHTPLVDVETFRLAQYQPVSRSEPRRPGLLYGIVRCASCGSYLTIWSSGLYGLWRGYRCSRVSTQRGACPQRTYVEAGALDALGEDLLFAIARRRPQLTRKVQLALRRAVDELALRERQFEAYRDNPVLLETLDDARFADGLARRLDAVREAAEVLADRRAASSDLELVKLRGIESRWADMDLGGRRAALGSVLDAIFIAPGRGNLEQRIWICETGEAPARLPRRGRPLPPRVFVFPTAERRVAQQRRRLVAARRYGWSEQQIETALREFLGERTIFPKPQVFVVAGQRRLYDHIVLRGGGPYWAARVGVDFPQGNRTKNLLWTEGRVRDQLAEFLADREQWPTMAEFEACGKMGLRRALVRFGGMHRWAEHFGLPIANFQGPHRTWTEERIEAALRELIGEGEQWPRRREFSAAGLDGCYAALWRGAGVQAWAGRMGVVLPASRGGRPAFRPTPR